MRPPLGMVGTFCLCALLLLAGCGDEGTDPVTAAPDVGVDVHGEPDVQDAGDDSDVAAGPISYQTHILPLFESTGCLGCHSADVAKGGHRLHTLDALLTTGPNAPVVVACDPAGSLLVQKLRDSPPVGEQMPQGGPYFTDEQIGLVEMWIASKPDELGPCPEVEPVPPLVEDRVFRVSERTELLTTRVQLPDSLAGGSELFAVEGRRHIGFVGAGGGYLRVDRNAETELISPGWDGDQNLGDVRGVASIPDRTLIATEIGLLYEAEGHLWPSPVDEVIASPVAALLADVRTVPGRPAIWLATGRGLFQLVDDELFEVRPAQEAAGTPVTAMALGPEPTDPDRDAVWVAFGEQVYAVRPDDDGVMAYTFEIAFEDPVIDIESDGLGRVWVVTEKGLFLRRPANVVGVARWIHWVLPEGQLAVDVAVYRDGATWVLTNAALYRALDAEWRWQLALGAPASDVVGMTVGDQGSVWLTRRDELVQLSPQPTVGIVGLVRGQTLDAFPDVEAFPAFPDQVTQVSITIDECVPVILEAGPYVVTGGALVWNECLSAGEHVLRVDVVYDGLAPVGAEVGFGWLEREEQITWRSHIEPLVYMRSCARPGCHIDGFEPDGYDAWVEKIEPIIQRTDPATVQGRMPPNGPRLTESERLLIQWWRDDGFLVE